MMKIPTSRWRFRSSSVLFRVAGAVFGSACVLTLYGNVHAAWGASTHSDTRSNDADKVVTQAGAENSEKPGDLEPSLSESLFEDGVACAREGRFNDSFSRIRSAYELEPTRIKYRRAIVVLQRLSSRAFLVRRIEDRMTAAPDERSMRALMDEAVQIRQSLANLPRETHVPDAFWEVRDRLVQKASGLVATIAAAEECLDAERDAARYFQEGRYNDELRCLLQVAKWRPDRADAVTGCQRVVDGLRCYEQGALEKALAHFRGVVPGDRHFAIAQRWDERIRRELMERELTEKLRVTWERLDWGDASSLTEDPSAPPLTEQSAAFRQLMDASRSLIDLHRSYLEARMKSDLAQMAVQWTRMSELAATHAAFAGFGSLREWLKAEWAWLSPAIETSFNRLSAEAAGAWRDYQSRAFDVNEISGWGADTNYDDVIARARLLGTAYARSREAIRLAEAASQMELNRASVELEPIESQVDMVCGNAFTRAYVLYRQLSDWRTASKLCEVAECLPATPNNSYHEQAASLLAEMRKPTVVHPQE